MPRHYTFFDKCCMSVDQALRTLNHAPESTGKSYPAQDVPEQLLTESERQHAACLMRVNHAGEVCAQALYHGQEWVTPSTITKDKLHQAGIEEGDHLLWCEKRLQELNSHTSYLNPFWYIGSFGIGVFAGMIGDPWSLGFVAETEQQVVKHLNKHLKLLPPQDQRSHKILQQMERDEAKHREEAIAAGAKALPEWVKKTMAMISKIMVKTTYWV